MLRQMEWWRGILADQFLLPPTVFAYAVALPVIILAGGLFCLVGAWGRSTGTEHQDIQPKRGISIITLALLLGAAIAAVVMLTSNASRAAAYMSLPALFSAGLLRSVARPESLRKSAQTGSRQPSDPVFPFWMRNLLALAAAGSIGAIILSVMVEAQNPADVRWPITLFLAGGLLGACAGLGPAGAPRAAIAALLALIAVAAAITQLDFDGLQRTIVQMLGITCASGSLCCVASLSSGAALTWPLGNSVLTGLALGVCAPIAAPAQAHSAIVHDLPENWKAAGPHAAWLLISPQAPLYSDGGAWFADASGPRADIVLLTVEETLSVEKSDRLLRRAKSSLRAGGRMIVELPAPRLADAALRTIRRADREQRPAAYLLRTAGSEQLALVVGHDVPDWLRRTLGREKELALYPVANKGQLADALLAVTAASLSP